MAEEVNIPKREPEVKMPLEAAELMKQRLDMAAGEDDARRTRRRSAELARPLEAHAAEVKAAHERHPAPLHRRWKKFTPQEKKNWNSRRRRIDAANRAYRDSVVEICELHRSEDAHLARLRAEKLAERRKGAA